MDPALLQTNARVMKDTHISPKKGIGYDGHVLFKNKIYLIKFSVALRFAIVARMESVLLLSLALVIWDLLEIQSSVNAFLSAQMDTFVVQKISKY